MPAILIVLLLEAEVDHHDAGVGPQERAVERGVLSQNGQALPRVNYHDPHHLNTNHSHLHLITAAITTLIRAPASVHSVVRSCGYYKDRRSTTASS